MNPLEFIQDLIFVSLCLGPLITMFQSYWNTGAASSIDLYYANIDQIYESIMSQDLSDVTKFGACEETIIKLYDIYEYIQTTYAISISLLVFVILLIILIILLSIVTLLFTCCICIISNSSWITMIICCRSYNKNIDVPIPENPELKNVDSIH